MCIRDRFTPEDLAYFLDLVTAFPVLVRFIEYMPVGAARLSAGPNPAAIKAMLEAAGRGSLEPVADKLGNGPAKYYRLRGTKGLFGFIAPLSEHFCRSCNRMRLTADGKLKPCLLSDREVDIKPILRNGGTDDMLAEAFAMAVQAKPEGHTLCRPSGHPEFQRQMFQIGG